MAEKIAMPCGNSPMVSRITEKAGDNAESCSNHLRHFVVLRVGGDGADAVGRNGSRESMQTRYQGILQ
jgi:hypothetical protein